MNKSTLINILPTAGRILTPVAMLVTLTREIVRSQSEGVSLGWLIAIHIGAIATVIGIEAVGILAGHTLEGYWRIGDKPRTVLAGILLGVYTAVGIVILLDNPVMIPIPIVAAVVYLISGLAESLDTEQQQQAKTAVSQSAYELEEAKKDREFERQLLLQKQADKTAVSLAKLKAKAVTNQAVTSRLDSGQLPGDARLHTPEHKQLIKTLTTSEIEQLAGVSDSTARRWKRRVTANGHLNGVSK